MLGTGRVCFATVGVVTLATLLFLADVPTVHAAGLGGSSSERTGGSYAKSATKSCVSTTKASAKIVRSGSANSVTFDVFLVGSYVREGYVYCKYDSRDLYVKKLRYRFRCRNAKAVSSSGKRQYECSE